MLGTPGVPGMVGRALPEERPERLLVVPSRSRASVVLVRLRLGGCWAAEDRRRRWPPAAAEKDGWGARVTSWGRRGSELVEGSSECSCATSEWHSVAHTRKCQGDRRYGTGDGGEGGLAVQALEVEASWRASCCCLPHGSARRLHWKREGSVEDNAVRRQRRWQSMAQVRVDCSMPRGN